MIRLLIATLFAIAACGGPEIPSRGPFRAEVFVLTGVNDDGTAEYGVREDELVGLDSVTRMEGEYFTFRWDTTFVAKQVVGSVAYNVDIKGAHIPDMALDLRDGTIIGLDYDSFLTLSAYHEFQVAHDAVFAAQATSLAGKQRNHVVNYRTALSEDGADSKIQLNAFYITEVDMFGLGFSSSIERAPLAANRVVLAHEFGHSVFQDTFVASDGICDPTDATAPDFTGRFRAWPEVAGFNEGFADLVAYGVTGVLDVLGGSLADFGKERALDARVPGYVDFRFSNRGDHCDASPYCTGTLFARAVLAAFFAQVGDHPTEAQRREFLRDIIDAAAQTPVAMRNHPEILPPVKMDEDCSEVEQDIFFPLPVNITVFLVGFIESMPVPYRAALCANLQANFDENVDLGVVCDEAP